jgi:dipeptidyl aminopeptidase/acylaminoacyl peptidase
MNQNKQIAPYGSWSSPIHSRLLTQKSVRLSEPKLQADGTLFWLESRPQEKGRSVLMRQTGDKTVEVLPAEFSVTSSVHEYGGGSYCLTPNHVFFVNGKDQNVYQYRLNGSDQPIALTSQKSCRYADLEFDALHKRILCVQEIHTKDCEAVNQIIAIDITTKATTVIASGCDFYSNPRLSPDQQQLCWLSWNHPSMPWDNTECWIADIDYQGKLTHPTHIAGGTSSQAQGESIFQPQWHKNGNLFFVSDRNNWWNLYCYQQTGHKQGRITSITNLEAEFATPQWVFGMSCYGFLSEEEVLATCTQNGRWRLVHINLLTLELSFIEPTSDASPWTDISSITCNGNGSAALLAASATQASSLNTMSFISNKLEHQNIACYSSQNNLLIEDISQPTSITFNTGKQKNDQAYGFYYPPQNARFEGEADTQPPVIVLCHGGPTGATDTGLNLKIQYWTSRGFAVADINYRGSTGYGRQYRQKLNNNWGITDVEDVCAAVDYLATQKLIDPTKAVIKGSSAGGYTVLAALTFSDTFTAGTSLYGIGNLETLALDTHKFEARYMDSLVGPYPATKQIYLDRSPLFHADKLNCPVIFFQGLDDKVVPPNQASAMVNALKSKGVPVAHVEFKGEGHGFRQASSIQQCLENELSFYAQLFEFEIDKSIEPVTMML